MKAIAKRNCYDNDLKQYYKAGQAVEIDPQSPIAQHFVDAAGKPVMSKAEYKKLKDAGKFAKSEDEPVEKAKPEKAKPETEQGTQGA